MAHFSMESYDFLQGKGNGVRQVVPAFSKDLPVFQPDFFLEFACKGLFLGFAFLYPALWKTPVRAFLEGGNLFDDEHFALAEHDAQDILPDSLLHLRTTLMGV